MVIIGCDFHPGFQQIAMLDAGSGEVKEMRLAHKEEAGRFYASLQGQEVLVWVEACGYTQWFEQMLEQMGHRYQIGDAAAIRASYVRKQKTDRRDAGHIPMPAIFCACWWKGGFRRCGCRRRPSGMRGN